MFAPNVAHDEAAIRAAYRLKDRCFEARDAARLITTDLPTFFAIEPDGTKESHAKIWRFMRWRFAHQVACRRREMPIRVLVRRNRARVEVFSTDDYKVREGTNVRRRILRTHGWSDWVRTPSGWKQGSLRLDRSEWLDPQGIWRRG